MNIFLSISIAIAVIAIVVLVVFVIIAYKSIKRTYDDMAVTIKELEQQMNSITTETTALLNKTNKIADDVSEKSAKLDVLFDGVRGVGTTVQSFNNTLKNFSSRIKTSNTDEEGNASQVLKWGNVLIDLWKKKNK